MKMKMTLSMIKFQQKTLDKLNQFINSQIMSHNKASIKIFRLKNGETRIT